MEIWLNAVTDYGFPAAITFYLLYRIEKKLDILNASVINLERTCPAAHTGLNSADNLSLVRKPFTAYPAKGHE